MKNWYQVFDIVVKIKNKTSKIDSPKFYVSAQSQVWIVKVEYQNHDSEDMSEIQNLTPKSTYSNYTCGIPHKALLKNYKTSQHTIKLTYL